MRHSCRDSSLSIGFSGGCNRHHYAWNDCTEGTVMRHFVNLPRSPGALAGCMSTRTTVALLIALPGTQQRLAPTYARAVSDAVLVAAITAAADAHLLRAPPATVQPIRVLACPHAPRTPHWTTPRIAGIKTARTRASCRAS